MELHQDAYLEQESLWFSFLNQEMNFLAVEGIVSTSSNTSIKCLEIYIKLNFHTDFFSSQFQSLNQGKKTERLFC